MGSAIIKGKLYQNVNFVNSIEKADAEVVYDKVEYYKDDNVWLYFYRNYLVATAQ